MASSLTRSSGLRLASAKRGSASQARRKPAAPSLP